MKISSTYKKCFRHLSPVTSLQIIEANSFMEMSGVSSEDKELIVSGERDGGGLL
jgi:hypothetical protein